VVRQPPDGDGRFDEAEQEVREALTVEPSRFMPEAVLGWEWHYRGDYERAIAQYRSAGESDPTNAFLNLWHGQALESVGRTDEALVCLRRARATSGQSVIVAAAGPDPRHPGRARRGRAVARCRRAQPNRAIVRGREGPSRVGAARHRDPLA
jgi:tetratricopeptide (TPR) repeat protein